MTAPRVTKPELSLLEDLRYAVHGLCAPFVCGGTLVPDQPLTLRFQDQTQLPVLRAPKGLRTGADPAAVGSALHPAPFGKGRQTRYDRSVRNALQLKAESGAFSVLNFDPQRRAYSSKSAASSCRRTRPPTAELYNLNVYARDGHFVPHKDTPRGSDMLGTLVVCLPSQFSNGALVVKHQGVFQTFDWGEAIRQQADRRASTGRPSSVTSSIRSSRSGEASA